MAVAVVWCQWEGHTYERAKIIEYFQSPLSTARLGQHAVAMGLRMCPLSMTQVPQLLIPNYTLRQTIETYNHTEDWDELAMFALQAPNQS